MALADSLKRLRLVERALPTIGVAVALGFGYLAGSHVYTPVPTSGEIKIAVRDAVAPVRNDVRDLAAKVATPAKPVVVTVPVAPQPVVAPAPAPEPVAAPKKVKKKKPDTYFFGLLNKA